MTHGTDRGRFALVPFEPPSNLHFGRIQMSLLQTCKQIYQEAKDVVYEQNTLALLGPDQLLYEFRELDKAISHRVRNIWLAVNLADRSQLKSTARALEVLSIWAQQSGSLRNVTLCVSSGNTAMHDLMDLRLFGESETTFTGEFNQNVGAKLFQQYLKVLRNSWGKYDGQWAGVKRRLELRIGYLKDLAIYHPKELVEELHKAFGGELWIDGRPCYKDGIEIVQPFQRDFRGAWQVVWFREDDNWYWRR
jgi:hypothetical protein